MNLQYKINLTSLTILAIVTFALSAAGVVAITRISYDLNSKLMMKEVGNLQGNILAAITILEQSGVAAVESYQERAKSDVLTGFRNYTFGETGMLIVVDKKNGKALLNGPANISDQEFLNEITQFNSGSINHTYGDESRFFYYAGHNEWDWLLILSERTDKIFEVRRRFIEIVVIIMTTSLGIGSILLLWSTNRIVRPIRLLAKAADGISHGLWQTDLPSVQGRDEIAQLTRSFEEMSEKLSATYADLNENINKIKKSQEELSTEKERLAITLRSIGDGVISTDINGKITLINERAEELIGWNQEEALGQSVEKVFRLIDPNNSRREIDPVFSIIRSGGKEIFSEQVTLISRDSNRRVLSVNCAPIFGVKAVKLGVILVFRDITEFLKMQEELAKSHKLESVGILAGGIAHDFNNILTGILGNLSLAKLSVDKDDSLLKKLDDAERASLRAKDLTKQLLTFSKGGEPVKKLVDLSATIRETASFALAGSNCSCEFALADDLWSVEVDEGQISQVIHNLVINASQSMPGGGKVLVSSENVSVGQHDPILTEAGTFLKISIIDEGYGIEKTELAKIFDPYYSTKEGGSGLGLASAYSIIKKHSGAIRVTSEPGEGSAFEIYLPASERKAGIEQGPRQELITGSGRVLVLDDEQIVRDIAGTMLAALGYNADSANDGETAITKYQKAMETGNRYDLVIMDLTIPGGMGGKEAMHRLLQIDPEAIAIVSSGYANDPIMANYKDYGFSAVLSKPFSLDQLSTTIADLPARKKSDNRRTAPE